jgi:hypothetical protein
MNCKPGDLAVIVRQATNEPRSLGAIVEVLRAGPGSCYHGLVGLQPNWWVRSSSPLRTFAHGERTEFVVPDAYMRPLRDSDGADEMLVGKPQEVSA